MTSCLLKFLKRVSFKIISKNTRNSTVKKTWCFLEETFQFKHLQYDYFSITISLTSGRLGVSSDEKNFKNEKFKPLLSPVNKKEIQSN
jgi:hypothetical protein